MVTAEFSEGPVDLEGLCHCDCTVIGDVVGRDVEENQGGINFECRSNLRQATVFDVMTRDHESGECGIHVESCGQGTDTIMFLQKDT